MDGLIMPPGQGRKLVTNAHEVTFKVLAEHGSGVSTFEVLVPPGFDVGAHTHIHSEEFFYILEGELEVLAFEPVERTEERWQDWKSPDGAAAVHARVGSCMFVPPGCPHAFRNSTDKPARMLFQSAPAPDHERYFEEMIEILSSGETVDQQAMHSLRERYGLTQITPLRYEPPATA